MFVVGLEGWLGKSFCVEFFLISTELELVVDEGVGFKLVHYSDMSVEES